MDEFLEMFPKKYHKILKDGIRSGYINPSQMMKKLHSSDRKIRNESKEVIRRFLGLHRLRLTKPTPKVAHRIPLLDLMERPRHEGKRNQFQLLRTLSLVNKDFNTAFRQELKSYEKDIKGVVSLCHFFDLTRKFPKSEHNHLVGVQFILDDPKVGVNSRTNYHILLQDNQFKLVRHNYADGSVKTTEFPNTKNGFIELMDVFIPILKSSVIGLSMYDGLLRPLTAFDKKMLKRYNLVQDQAFVEIINPEVFRVNPETISHWDGSYLNQEPWYY